MTRGQGGYWYASAIRASKLPPNARHIAHALASVADNGSGRVQVSLTWLQHATGLSRSSVAKYLNVLEAEGWLLRNRAAPWAAIKLHERTEYVTVIPAGYPTKASPSHALPSATQGLGLVRESDQASPSAALSTTSTKAAAPSAGASVPAPITNGDVGADDEEHGLPRNLGGYCDCQPARPAADGECIACGGAAA
jgi:hypothetical protein